MMQQPDNDMFFREREQERERKRCLDPVRFMIKQLLKERERDVWTPSTTTVEE